MTYKRKQDDRVRTLSLSPELWHRLDVLAQAAQNQGVAPPRRGARSWVARKVIEYGLPALEDDLRVNPK